MALLARPGIGLAQTPAEMARQRKRYLGCDLGMGFQQTHEVGTEEHHQPAIGVRAGLRRPGRLVKQRQLAEHVACAQPREPQHLSAVGAQDVDFAFGDGVDGLPFVTLIEHHFVGQILPLVAQRLHHFQLAPAQRREKAYLAQRMQGILRRVAAEQTHVGLRSKVGIETSAQAYRLLCTRRLHRRGRTREFALSSRVTGTATKTDILMNSRLLRWIDNNILSLGRDMRASYLPPLMVYMAAGIQGLTGIVGTFFVKDYLGLSAEFLAALGFWVGIPWALKIPLGHLVDLLWRYKSALIFVGASLISASLLIMAGLIAEREAMAAVMPVNAWFVLSALLSPVGYVLQDAVADAMTVEAVPRFDADGTAVPADRLKLMHTTMQTLGRVAIIGGSVLVALVNLYLFSGTETAPEAEKAAIYLQVYLMALIIPVVSVAGVVFAAILKRRQIAAHMAHGMSRAEALTLLRDPDSGTHANWWILGGSLVFVAFTLTMGLSDVKWNQEIIFIGSFAIITFLMAKLTLELEPAARNTLIGTALVIFMFRATPTTGPGVSWWSIDALGFDQAFFSVLSLIGSALTLAGMFLFRRFMAERSILYVVGFLTAASFVLSMPTLGMSLGLHEWTSRVTGGIVDARFIAVIDTALESPLGQISMIPMLAWIANSAPAHLKATFFAVMASFTNLALSASQLGTKYLNQIYILAREVRDPATGAVVTAANYQDLTQLLVTVIAIGVAMPVGAILVACALHLRSA
jgi:hypothetical protein